MAPTDVPYPRFREVETERTDFKRKFEAAVNELAPTREKLTFAERQIAELQASRTETSETLETYLAVLDRDPELRARVLELLNTMPPGTPRRAAGAPATPGRPGAGDPALPPELQGRLDKVLGLIEQADRQNSQREAGAAQAELNTRVAQAASEYLTQREYDPAQVIDPASNLKLLDVVMQFVGDQAAARGLERIEDLPYLLNSWYAQQEAIINHRLRGYSAAKLGDATVLPPPVPGGSPAQAAERPLPLSDPRFAGRVIAAWAASRAAREATA